MVQTMTSRVDSPPFDLQAYQPPISLWRLVEQHTPRHEREEIKNMLGESLVDQSLELHEEINVLLEIWRDYREETTTVKPVSRLPEPPGVRDRLIQEIQFFVGSVKEKAKSEGVNSDKIFSRHNTDILDYALDTQRAESARPSSRQAAFGYDGRETPMICSPSCSDRTSEASILSEEVEGMNDKLNILKFDEVILHLRSTLEEEVETLLRDINFLQNCLDEEATFRAESTGTLTREPTLTDLREERSHLEKDLLSNMKSQASPDLKKQPFMPPNAIKTLGPSPVNKLKPSQGNETRNAPGPLKPGPLKAFTSPDSRVGGASPPGPIRAQSSRKEPIRTHTQNSSVEHSNSSGPMKMSMGASSSKPQFESRSSHVHTRQQMDDSVSSNSTRRKVLSSAGKSIRTNRVDTNTRKHGDHDFSYASKGSVQPTLEAVVTLSKGKSGDAPDVQMVPSPPSSAKPSTPRPSSAQRFRSMVLDCRETK